MRKKHSWLSIVSFILIFFGVFLLLLPRLASHVIIKRTDDNISYIEHMDAEQLKENMNKESTFDFDQISQINPSKTLLSSEYIDKDLIVGRLFIPSTDLNLPVFNGVTDNILHAGVGTMRPNLEMGEGNFPIAGHYSHNQSTLFGDLYSIEEGDNIYLTNNEFIYKYKAYRTEIAVDTDIHYIQEDFAKQHGKPIISLMNCYYVNGRDTGDRYFVFGELVDTYSTNEISFPSK